MDENHVLDFAWRYSINTKKKPTKQRKNHNDVTETTQTNRKIIAVFELCECIVFIKKALWVVIVEEDAFCVSRHVSSNLIYYKTKFQ